MATPHFSTRESVDRRERNKYQNLVAKGSRISDNELLVSDNINREIESKFIESEAGSRLH